jgi:ubiquinone/menaquinone biosynthesis C-methylase UbiE
LNKLKQIDAPMGLIMFFGPSILFVFLAFKTSDNFAGYIITSAICAVFGLIYIHTSLFGKDKILQKVADSIQLKQNSKILDVGCGHGAFMIKFENRINDIRKIVGIDIWNKRDQANNTLEETEKTVTNSGVSSKAKIQRADMCDLPFQDNEFDLVISSFAIHNVKPATQRRKAIEEIFRVLKHNGEVVIIDIEFKDKEYRKILEELKFNNIETSGAGFNGWWGSPLGPTFILKAVKS